MKIARKGNQQLGRERGRTGCVWAGVEGLKFDSRVVVVVGCRIGRVIRKRKKRRRRRWWWERKREGREVEEEEEH